MKELDKNLISNADFNSAVGMGSIINRTYQANIETVNNYDLTEEEKENAINKLYDLSMNELQLYSNLYPSISTVGPARYNVKKGLSALDKKTQAAEETRIFMNTLRVEQNKKISAIKNQILITAFQEAVKNKQKEFTANGVEYVVRGRTRFIEKKYAV
jgi:hypothetical protein